MVRCEIDSYGSYGSELVNQWTTLLAAKVTWRLENNRNVKWMKWKAAQAQRDTKSLQMFTDYIVWMWTCLDQLCDNFMRSKDFSWPSSISTVCFHVLSFRQSETRKFWVVERVEPGCRARCRTLCIVGNVEHVELIHIAAVTVDASNWPSQAVVTVDIKQRAKIVHTQLRGDFGDFCKIW